MECSIIISSCNRAASLENTLCAFNSVLIPDGWTAELIIVDNASRDNTSEVVNRNKLPNFQIRYLYEGKLGKSNALNAGLAIAQGEVLLFTDDDVVPRPDWLEKLALPLVQGEYHGVVGQIQLAENLSKPWMTSDHKMALAVFDATCPSVKELIGANMGVHRSVFDRISGFDPELGPGASGFGEETLLSWQMIEAGFRLGAVPDAIVVHSPEDSRLLRSAWIKGAQTRGRSMAYLLHHWQHNVIRAPLLRFYKVAMKLQCRRLLQFPLSAEEQYCPAWEMSYVAEMAMCRHFIQESMRPRNYERYGLQKKNIAFPTSTESAAA